MALLVAALLANAGRVSAQGVSAPLVDSIAIITHDVFTAEEVLVNPAFGVMNSLHYHTRPWVVRRELLFREGQPYDSALVRETERNLRGLGLFRGALADTLRVNGRLVVRVQTLDAWTTALELNGRSTGGVFTWSTGFSERNVLGTGNAGLIRYRKDPDRSIFTVQAGLRRFLGTRLEALAYYDGQSDGHYTGGNVSRPYRSLSDRYAVEVSGFTGRSRVLQFRSDTLFATWQRRASIARALVSMAPAASPRGFVRLGLTGQVRDEEYLRAADTLLAVPDTTTGALAAWVRALRGRFTVVSHYNGFARQEDIDLSSWVLVGAWVAPAAFGYARTGVGPFLEAQTGVPLGASFARVGVRANGLFTGAGLDSGRVTAAATLALRFFPRNATVFRVDVSRLKGPPPGGETDLGHGTGPRSFGPHAFTGTRGVWGTVEHRVFLIDELLSVLGVGAAAFLDYGGAWYPDQPRRLGGNVGLGLRLGPTRATGTNLGRFDLAYRFGEGAGGGGWVFSVGRAVSY